MGSELHYIISLKKSTLEMSFISRYPPRLIFIHDVNVVQWFCLLSWCIIFHFAAVPGGVSMTEKLNGQLLGYPSRSCAVTFTYGASLQTLCTGFTRVGQLSLMSSTLIRTVPVMVFLRSS